MTAVYVADASAAETRLDVYLAGKTGTSRSRIKNLVDGGAITVNGKRVKAGYSLREGDRVDADIPETVPMTAEPEDIPVEIIYEDDSIAVVNKPRGMVVHPAAGNRDGTLVNALLFRLNALSGVNGALRPGIVHRLDKDTSGLLVVAKTDSAHRKLQEQIRRREAKRFYLALLDGDVKENEGVIDCPVGRSRADRKKMTVTPDGKPAETRYRVLERFGKYTLCEFELITGRTHQIRVHARHINRPVAGDGTYGGSGGFGGQMLHSCRLVIRHPETGEVLTFASPPPPYFEEVLEKLRRGVREKTGAGEGR